MHRLRLPLATCLLGLSAIAAIPERAQADAVSDFYRGKTVTIIVGYTAGGGYDLYARALGRHMGKHLPGNPNFIVQNITGAGSLNAANHLYNVAAKDGTVFATFGRGLPMEPLIGTAKVQFDATKFTWLGSGANEISICATWHTSPVKTWADMLKTSFAVGGEGAGSDPDSYSLLVRNIFGAKLKLVSGYHGTSDIILAIERGEVDGRCGWSWSSIKATRMSWYEQKIVHVLMQFSLAKHADLPQIPLITDLARTPEQQRIFKLIFARQVMGRPYMAPPGIPADRAAALRKAFMDTMADKEFLAEAEKAKFEITPVSGEKVATLVEEIYRTTSAADAEKAAGMVK
jgi:tripartite-type tricarboxylate transporter receptor subunit TctC